MATIVTRTGKGSALSFAEADANFTNLNTDKVETTALAAHESDTSTHGVVGNIVGDSDAQIVTNKTISLTNNSVTGTKAEFDAALSDDDFTYAGVLASNATGQGASLVGLDLTDQTLEAGVSQQVAGVTALRGITPVANRVVYLKYHTAAGDSGHGKFRAITGMAPGTYTDDNGITIIPTGGDGSSAWVREYSGAVNIKWFNAKGDGTTDDVGAFNSLVAWINASGSATRSNYATIHVYIPEGVYNVKAGGINAVLVSNVSITCSKSAVFKMRDGAVWTLGSAGTTIENFWVRGGYPVTDVADTPAVGCAWVYGVNCARVFIDDLQCYRVPHLFKGVSTTTLSGIYIRDVYGLGHPSYNWVDIDTTGASAASALYLINVNGYPYAPPANPAILPKAITGATQANPVEITCVGHGFSTGDKIRIGGVVGMTELNGNDYTITVTGVDTFTLDGIDGTAFTAYVSGGWAVELHWANAYQTAVVSINGKWDTAKIQGGVLQHWAWLWNLTATGQISFIFDENVTWDYGGEGRFNMTFSGGSISQVMVNGGWTFTMNNDWLKTTRTTSGFLSSISVRNHRIGLIGGSISNDASKNHIIDITFDNCGVIAVGRARVGNAFLFELGLNAKTNISGVSQTDPTATYGAGSTTYLLPDIGIRQSTAGTSYKLSNNTVYAVTTNYSIPTESTYAVGRMVRGNVTYTGALPEYVLTTAGVTMPATGVNTLNPTGLTETVNLRGGTITNVLKNGNVILSGIAAYSFDVGPGETWACNYTVTPTLVYSYRD